jgi:hypothetical protein
MLANIGGPKFVEMVNGQNTEYYTRLLEQMQTQVETVTQRSQWDTFLDEQFEVAKRAGHDEGITAEVTLHTVGTIEQGIMRRVEGSSKLLALTTKETTRHFSSRDVIMMTVVPQVSSS